MDISSINTSYAGYYDTLTSPFTTKKVTIHSYTPYNPAQQSQGTFSRKDFYTRTKTYEKFNLNSASQGFKSPNNIIENSISAGYSPMEAVQMYKAQRAYGLSAIGTTGGVTRMSTGYYTV